MHSLYFVEHYDAPRLRVWSALQEPDTWTALTGVDEVVGVQMNGDELAAIQWRSKIGPRLVRGETRVAESVKPNLMAMVVDGGEIIALTTASLHEVGSETRVEVSGQLEAHGFMAHLLLPVVTASIERAMPTALERLNDFL